MDSHFLHSPFPMSREERILNVGIPPIIGYFRQRKYQRIGSQTKYYLLDTFLAGWRRANFAVLNTNDLILIVKIFSVMVTGQLRPSKTRGMQNNGGWQYGICTHPRMESCNWAHNIKNTKLNHQPPKKLDLEKHACSFPICSVLLSMRIKSSIYFGFKKDSNVMQRSSLTLYFRNLGNIKTKA